MSDFLSKFSGDQYKKKSLEVKKEEAVTSSKVNQEEAKDNVTEAKKIETKVQEEMSTTENINKNLFKTSAVRNETYVRDDERIKARKRKILIGIACVIVICTGGYFTYQKINEVTVPNFVDEKSMDEVNVWAAKNKIDIVSKSKFSVKVDEGLIISQSKKGGQCMQKGGTLEVIASKGADPEEHIELPDFSSMNLTKIEAWKEKNKASNLSIQKVFDEEVENGNVIKFSFLTEGIDAKTYRRKDKIEVTISKGKEVFEKNIVVPDFKNKSKSEVDSWAEKNEVKIEYTDAANDKIMEGMIISQDIAPKTKIAKRDILNIIVSKGKVAYVPSFYGMDETQAQIVASSAGISINSLQYYSATIPEGSLISQSIPAGTEIRDQNVALVYSIGNPYFPNCDGEDTMVGVEEIRKMNSMGAQLSYQIIEVGSEEPKGKIVDSNYKGTFVPVGGTIVIYVSRGY